jgi:hypothetical protein
MPARSDQFYRLLEAANLKKQIAALMDEGVTEEEIAKMLGQCIAEHSDCVPPDYLMLSKCHSWLAEHYTAKAWNRRRLERARPLDLCAGSGLYPPPGPPLRTSSALPTVLDPMFAL